MMQVVWSIENAEMRRKIAIYKTPLKSSGSLFSRRASVRSRKPKIFTQEEIASFIAKKEKR